MDRPVRGAGVSLTHQQARILARHASGRTLVEVAREEFVSVRQMERMTMAIRTTLGARNMAQAVMVAHGLGYLSLPDDDGLVRHQSPFDRISA